MVKGLSASNCGEAVFNYLNEADKQGDPIVVFSSAVGAPGLSKISPWGFRNTFSEVNVVGRVAAEVQKRLGTKTAAFYIMKDNVVFSVAVRKGHHAGAEESSASRWWR